MIKEKIIGLFLSDLDCSLTINQIAKKLKKSYASINKHTRGLIDDKILNKQIVGSAILCSLNYENDLTIAYIVLNSIIKTNSSKIAIPKDIVENDEILCSFHCKNKHYVFALENSISKKYYPFNRESIVKIIKKHSLKNITITKNHEIFWRMIAEKKI